MWLDQSHPALEEVNRIRKYIGDQEWNEDQWYELYVPRQDEKGSFSTFDFWFETRNMALMTRLSA